MGFADQMDWAVRKIGIKNDNRVFGLSDWKGVTNNSDGRSGGRSKFKREELDLVLDVLDFRGLSDSQVGGIMEMATCVCVCMEFRGGALAGITNLRELND